MRTPALVLVAASLLACGQEPSCPGGRSFSEPELLLFQEVAELAEFPEASPPLLAEQEVDKSCGGGWNVRTPSGECVGAYYAPSCETATLPAGVREAWPEYADFLVRHESLHAVLHQKYGDPDQGHEGALWQAIRPPWEGS